MQDSSADTLPPATSKYSEGVIPDQTSNDSLPDLEKDLEKGGSDPQGNNVPFQGDKNIEPKKEEENTVVGWDGPDDPGNPMNWPNSKKYTVTVFYASLTFCLTFSSSVFSTATMVTAKMFGVSNEVMTLGTSLFVLVRCPLNYLHYNGIWLTLPTGFCIWAYTLGTFE